MSKLLWAGVAVAVLMSLVAVFGVKTPEIQKVVEKSFGGTSHITSLDVAEDLSVAGALTVTGATTLSSLTLASSNVALANAAVITMTSGTTTPCAVRNTSGASRTLVSIGVTERGTAASLGRIRFTSGTGTTAFKTTYSTKFLNGAIVKASGVDVLSTTSTLMSAYAPWRNNEWLVLYSATTVHAGTCRVLYY